MFQACLSRHKERNEQERTVSLRFVGYPEKQVDGEGGTVQVVEVRPIGSELGETTASRPGVTIRQPSKPVC